MDSLKIDFNKIINNYNTGNFYNKSETDSKDNVVLSSSKAYTNSSIYGIKSLPETFFNLAAIQSKYPNGANGVMVAADNGHKYIWANNIWTDAGVYQSVGIADGSVTFSKQTNLGHVGYHITDSVLPNFDFTNNILVFFGTNRLIVGNRRKSILTKTVDIPTAQGGYFLVYNTDTATTEFVLFEGLLEEHIVFGAIRNNIGSRYVIFFNGQYSVNGTGQSDPIHQWATFFSNGGYIDFDFDTKKITIPSLGFLSCPTRNFKIAEKDITLDMDTFSTTILVYNVQTGLVEIVPYDGVGYEHYIIAYIRYDKQSVWTVGPFTIGGKLFGIDTSTQTTEQTYTDNLMQIFPDYTTIGDSLTAGFTSVGGVITSSADAALTKNNYPGYLELRTGRPFKNIAVGGSTSADWRTTHIQTGNIPSSAYTVALGVNDARQGLPVGTPADIVETRTNNANTFYGNYDFVIRELQSYNTNAHLFVFTIPPHETNAENYNVAIRYVASLYDKVHLIDLYKLYYEEYTTGFLPENYVNSHYTPMTYNYISTMIEKAINQYIFENSKLFQSVPYA